MAYYEEKKRALNLIDSMFSEGKSIDQVTFKISKLFGFGRLMVSKRFELLNRMIGEKENEGSS